MTLHPWPLNDTPSAADHVLWSGNRGCGLLTETQAVPLRFTGEAPGRAQAQAPDPSAAAAESLTNDFNSALLRFHRR